MIDFDIVWQDASGVRDAVLARTWCCLTIRVNGQFVTRVMDRRTNGWRNGIFGSAFPLCCWVVDNLWFLLYEPYRWPVRYGSRDLARDAAARDWAQRHSLLAAREGGALPDLTLYGDGDAVVAHWLRDGGDTSHPFLRFVKEGAASLEPTAVREGLGRFVERVLERTADMHQPAVVQLRDDWNELGQLTQEERDLCAWSARLGVNAHYEDELSEPLEDLLRAEVPGMGMDLAKDLLDAATIDGVAQDVEWIAEAHSIAQRARCGGANAMLSGPWLVTMEQTAHQTGYVHAEILRGRTGIPCAPMADLPGFMCRMGWADSPIVAMNLSPGSPLLDAVVDYGQDGTPVVASHRSGPGSYERLLLARSLFMKNRSATGQRRLVTESHTWDQRASRAFAAEFLAPARALSGRIGSSFVSGGEVEALAEEFDVDSRVIRRQIANHRLAAVDQVAEAP